MDTVVVILGGVCLLLGAGAAWLAWSRGRLLAEAGVLRERAEAAERERDAGAERAAGLERERDRLTRRELELSTDAARLGEQLSAARGQIEQERAHARNALVEREQSLRERHEAERRLVETKLREMEELLKTQFAALSGEALKAAGEQFLRRAEQTLGQREKVTVAEVEQRRQAIEGLVKPIGEVLERTRLQLSALGARVDESKSSAEDLRKETERLTRALARPEVRGQYGEIQLRRVAELAGMTAYCDFSEQVSQRGDDGSVVRPDLIVRLPNDRVVAVDAKTNILAYVEAASATDSAAREQALERFARHVEEQVGKLSGKRYWSAFEGSPDFVVMFVPGDQFIDAALARRPGLLEEAARQNVILASPSTLIGLLRAVAVGWREHGLAEEARTLLGLGKELHERVAVVLEHARGLGRSLNGAVESYNKFVGSVDSRVLPTLRKFEKEGVTSGRELAEPAEIEVRARERAALAGGREGREGPGGDTAGGTGR